MAQWCGGTTVDAKSQQQEHVSLTKVVNIETTPGGRVNQDTSSSAVSIKELLQQNIPTGRPKTGKLCDRSG